MDYITVTAAFVSLSGTLHLTDAQAAARKHLLKALGDNRFATIGPAGFKAGEVLGYEGERNAGVEVNPDMSAKGFERRVKDERAAAAAAKKQVLDARAARDKQIREIQAQRRAAAERDRAHKAEQARARHDGESSAPAVEQSAAIL